MNARRPFALVLTPAIPRRRLLCLLVLCGPLGFFPEAAAAADRPPPQEPGSQVDLAELSLEELMDVEVISVSKRAERISAAAAAVYVITQEDLRRSGATSIPEALRMVPGVEVARIDANKWAISARGFNGRFANKLLVLIDGRSVYTPLFSGVFWDVQDTLLEDIERIEVIRGPGATLWGANAVNGVINIITRSAWETAGNLLTAGSGSEERGFLGFRHGGLLGESSAYRLYAKAFERDDGVAPDGGDGADGWWMRRGGFRTDRKLPTGGELTLQGDLYEGEVGETLTITPLESLLSPRTETVAADSRISGGNLLTRWRHRLSGASELTVQLYYDRTERAASILDETRDTADFELQHGFAPTPRHQVVWGFGYRRTADDIAGGEFVSFSPGRRTDELVSAFIQDEITLRPDRLWLTVGSKFEHNDYSGFEVQPNLRALWTPRRHHSVWAAVSRAVRTPSRAEHDFRLNSLVLGPGALFPNSPPAVAATFGDRSFDSEELLAYEIGYRAGLGPGLFVDFAGFYNRYDRLRSVRTGEPFLAAGPPPHLVIPARVSNDLEGETYGAEMAADWRVSDRWRLSAAYSWLGMRLRSRLQDGDDAAASLEGASPQHQLFLRSSVDLPRDLELDLTMRYVDRLDEPRVDSYSGLGLRLGWKVRPDVDLSLLGSNLLDGDHLEFAPEVIPTHPTAAERSVHGKVTWRF